MAKLVSLDEAILAGLRKAVRALPANLIMYGTKGVFASRGEGPLHAQTAIERGFLIAKKETDKTGKKPKTVEYAIITEKGFQHVADADGPKAVLEALLPAVQVLGKAPNSPDPAAFRSELERATETCVNVIRESFGKLEGAVLKALSPPTAPAANSGMILQALHRALERVKSPVPIVTPAAPPPIANPTDQTLAALDSEILTFLGNWSKEKSVGCQFDVLWNHLLTRHPQLSTGTFQDALRGLYEANRIRLTGWPRMHDEIPLPQLAFFVSSKVMYYAHPAHTSG
jgi:hypothetical protein